MGAAPMTAAPSRRARGEVGTGRTGPYDARGDGRDHYAEAFHEGLHALAQYVQWARLPARASPHHGPRLTGTRVLQKGVEAFTQYIAREGRLPGRGVVQVLADGSEHRTGIWIANRRQRRDRLDQAQLETLAELGMEWAGS